MGQTRELNIKSKNLKVQYSNRKKKIVHRFKLKKTNNNKG